MRRYADVVNDKLSKPLFQANYPSESELSGKRVSNITMGWALKKHKSTRFSTAAKAYLNDKLLIGEEIRHRQPKLYGKCTENEMIRVVVYLLELTVSVLNRMQHTFLVLQQQKRNTVL